MSSDIMIILLPIPLFLWSNTTTRIKVTLCCIYAVGIFTMVSALLNKYYSFTDPYGPNWTFWESHLFGNVPPSTITTIHGNNNRPSLIFADSQIELSQEHGIPLEAYQHCEIEVRVESTAKGKHHSASQGSSIDISLWVA
uniref:Uncharacterized protein n=1 Tax=Fusarium oxysporum (strain Fo5176) TaxID=660025 RepID=A0A0C4BKS3_FUSOF